MIPDSEVFGLAEQLDVPVPNVEKDYVMGWLLWAIATDPVLNQNLVLKGGNCLRKLYFADTRFSDDLDFTALHLDARAVIQQQLDRVCRRASEASGIQFDLQRTIVEEKDTPDKECKAIDGRVYFRGFAGDANLSMRIKFDISDYERIVLPVQHHGIIHGYSDSPLLSGTKVTAYSLEEVLAEKLRSWIQRSRPRDVFDVVRIIQSDTVPIAKGQILSVFLKKTLFKGIPQAGKQEMLTEKKFTDIETSWLQAIICPRSARILAANAIKLFRDFIDALFAAANVHDAAPFTRTGGFGFGYRVRPDIREPIIQAGRARRLVRLRYDGRDRDVEPYSFRYKMRKEDGRGVEYFFGFDRTRGQTIKSFFLHEIERVSILPTTFTPRPRMTVEF